jgi:hypothetical protein
MQRQEDLLLLLRENVFEEHLFEVVQRTEDMTERDILQFL